MPVQIEHEPNRRVRAAHQRHVEAVGGSCARFRWSGSSPRASEIFPPSELEQARNWLAG